MDLLQVALVFLIILLSIFLSITGIQVFFILKDLKKSLDRLDKILSSGEGMAHTLEKPINAAVSVFSAIEKGARVVRELTQKPSRKPVSPPRRLFKKSR